jgi:hypothetical protein
MPLAVTPNFHHEVWSKALLTTVHHILLFLPFGENKAHSVVVVGEFNARDE